MSDINIEITVVEGSEININKSIKNFEFGKNVNFINELWENYETTDKYSDILLIDSLQLLNNKEELLNKYKLLL